MMMTMMKMIKVMSSFFFRVLEIGGNVHLLVQPSVDRILQLLAAYENLRVLSLVNYSLISISEDYFKHLINLETLFLWQCHPLLLESAKNSCNKNFKCEVSPVSPLRDIIYDTGEM